MNQPFTLIDTGFLEKAMDASALRGKVIASNIANIDNPGYTSKTVLFDAKLREAMEAEAAGDKTARAKLQPEVVEARGGIDIHTEMVSLAKNQILFNAYSSRISSMFSQLKWVIENSGR